MTANTETPRETDKQRLLCELARAKVAFQRRTILAAMGSPEPTIEVET